MPSGGQGLDVPRTDPRVPGSFASVLPRTIFASLEALMYVLLGFVAFCRYYVAINPCPSFYYYE
jgi:hypothetical protein